ncbi:MAG: hypothetical protein KIT62_09405 [Cyclobacteriaceae bacterium]|nr:hypothetical protein [Cyclobacteriaceae bacterium]
MKLFAPIVLLLLLPGCSDFEPFKGEKIKQYASAVIGYSSQWSSGDWSAQRALGEENVYPEYGDLSGAWASFTADGQREFLVLGFTESQTVKKIEVFETYNPGAVDSIFLRNSETQKWITVYAKAPRTDLPGEARVFSVHLIETQYKADAIRLAINSPAVAGWNEIDAVAITGQK